MFYLAIDQHAKHLTCNLRDEDGQVVLKRQVSTRWEKVYAFFENLGKQTIADGGYAAIIEVCGFNDWLIEMQTRMQSYRSLCPVVVFRNGTYRNRYGNLVHQFSGDSAQ